MKILKIVSGIGYYINAKNEWKEIIDIGKEDIYHLLNLIATNDIEMDLEDEKSNKISNDAGKIIYNNLRTELMKLNDSKEILNAEIEEIFSNANEQYKKDLISNVTYNVKDINSYDIEFKTSLNNETIVNETKKTEGIFEGIEEN